VRSHEVARGGHARLPPPGVPCRWWRLWLHVPPWNERAFEVLDVSGRINSGFRRVR
jgi:hypothetical protein